MTTVAIRGIIEIR